MKSTQATNTKLSQHKRLQSEYIEYKRYGEYGDDCDSNYCNQCSYLGTNDCKGSQDEKLYKYMLNICQRGAL